MTDVVDWARRVAESVNRLLSDFEDRFGYAPDTNEIVPRVADRGSELHFDARDRPPIPTAVGQFFAVIDEVALPDVWNGYFFGSAQRVSEGYERGKPRWLARGDEQIEIAIVGSDGGGTLYAVALGATGPVYRIEEAFTDNVVVRTLGEGQTRVLAPDFASFLELFAEQLETFATRGTPPQI